MDRIDREILGSVTQHGRITVSELASDLRLSASATRDRIRRLEDRGVISGYRATVSETTLGYPLDALVEIDLRPDTDLGQFEQALREQPAVVEAIHATGEHDYIVRLRCEDTDELHRVVRAFKTEFGATRTTTRLILSSTIEPRPRLPS